MHREQVIPSHEVVGGDEGGLSGGRGCSGDQVGISRLRHCPGVCKAARRQNLCPSPTPGWDADGDTPEFPTVPPAFAHHLPSGAATASWRRCCAPASSDIDQLRRATTRWPAGSHGFRRQCPHHRPGRVGARREIHVMTRGARAREAGAATALHRLRTPTGHPCRWTPTRSYSPRSGIWCCPRWKLDRGGILASPGST